MYKIEILFVFLKEKLIPFNSSVCEGVKKLTIKTNNIAKHFTGNKFQISFSKVILSAFLGRPSYHSFCGTEDSSKQHWHSPTEHLRITSLSLDILS